MTFNLAILVFGASFSTDLFIIASAEDCDLNILNSLENATKNASFQHKSSSVTSSDIKRKRSEMCATMQSKKMRAEYYKGSKSIELKIEKNTETNLAAWERQLEAGGTEYVWKNFNNLTEKDVKPLCIEAWKIQLPRILGIKVEGGMAIDCSPVFLPGPSKPYQNNNKYTGHFQYAEELKYITFSADLVRCNCAYLKIMEPSNTIKTVNKSKRFFYILSHTDVTHFILVPHGPAIGRRVQIANVCAINVNIC